MSKEAFDQGNEAFVDEKYEKAHEFYTKALQEDGKTDQRFTSKVLASRAHCSLQLKKFTDAVKDGEEAIQLDEKNVAAYLRKGLALYQQNLKEEALKVFARGLEFDGDNIKLKELHDKCKKELPAPADAHPKQKVTPPVKPEATAAAAAVPPPPPPKPKHSFYQTDGVVTIQIPIKSLKKDQVQLQTTDTTLHVETKIPSSGTDYSLDIDLAYPIDSARTTFNVTGSNIEIKLHKRQAVQWSSLDAKSVVGKTQPPVAMNRPVEEKTPSYPSSSQRAKDWNKLEAEIKKDEKENKDETGDANSIFQQLYKDSDENTRRAMNKSMYESGGTCLNMNWDEVSKGKVTCDPPDGMEWKKYDS